MTTSINGAQLAIQRGTSEAPQGLEPEALVVRREAAAFLRKLGYPVSEATLSTKATRGGGPPYRLFSGRALYQVGDLLNWARDATSPPRHRLLPVAVKSLHGASSATLSNNPNLD